MSIFNKKNITWSIIIIAIYALGQGLTVAGIIDSYTFMNIAPLAINIILAVSLNLITGITGQFSLGHAAFMAVGAYTSAILTSNFGMPFIVGIIGAAFMAAVSGVFIGIPTLRLKGDYLAIATLGFGEIIKTLLLNNEYVGGASGFNYIPLYTNWTWLFLMVVLTIVVISNFIKSKSGRACIAIREDEIAAEAMGINTTFYKVLAFAIGALFAGIAGALYGGYLSFITPESFGFMKSIDILVIVVFGGMGSITGSIVGAIAISFISIVLQGIPELRMVIYSVILFIIMVYRPQGIMGNYEFKLFKKGGAKNASIKG
ncbi:MULTISPECIES: branched-chain amino acid ABC transporter permease [Clostridium]|uniref:Amino acid/amide ABC transporter membrane protein 2, HAAT family n=1 Tax=Clostridium cadaveris TaxID=1529 RepID=A0A1I2N9I9_9CLOT|nr:branched-chain amino acid ABC transporter permease [Clostridium cadaveris]MDU4952634.1 branched-chain amino acid ABC transporter permease [Clostridium sp.]MDM8312816.1 branched-chain amino acid ABC transporter permease [Clostridium cadaveris]NME65610.1 branched-chain amino acid ABC transporter permease [Clostridium cadaveris]NWK11658.1 branched-chain amino acid ABC transporter permease [Clostridium cadaveris]SFG00412.1 amino acid/amide ABC transporter membrane protein 2, HAAT family [Clostr